MPKQEEKKETLVAPYTGAWIEIFVATKYGLTSKVAPYTGAWIEMPIKAEYVTVTFVAPYTGAWIEIRHLNGWFQLRSRRTLHGCVD